MVLSDKNIKWLSDNFGKNIRFKEPMSRHISFKAGGCTEAFVMPETVNDLKKLIKYSSENGVKYRLIGDGTNILVKENGFNGIIISLAKCCRGIIIEKESENSLDLRVMAGVKMRYLCRFAMDKKSRDMEFALGIPGTIRGAICMNAGTPMGQLSDIIKNLLVLWPDGNIEKIEKKDLDFGYRSLLWKDRRPVILGGSFSLTKTGLEIDEIKKKAKNILAKRYKSQPLEFPSAGCFFKNPDNDSAGRLIDIAGLKGKSLGGAQVSEKHGNFIINRKEATAKDILDLATMVQNLIFKKFGIRLEPEVVVLG